MNEENTLNELNKQNITQKQANIINSSDKNKKIFNFAICVILFIIVCIIKQPSSILSGCHLEKENAYYSYVGKDYYCNSKYYDKITIGTMSNLKFPDYDIIKNGYVIANMTRQDGQYICTNNSTQEKIYDCNPNMLKKMAIEISKSSSN